MQEFATQVCLAPSKVQGMLISWILGNDRSLRFSSWMLMMMMMMMMTVAIGVIGDEGEDECDS